MHIDDIHNSRVLGSFPVCLTGCVHHWVWASLGVCTTGCGHIMYLITDGHTHHQAFDKPVRHQWHILGSTSSDPHGHQNRNLPITSQHHTHVATRYVEFVSTLFNGYDFKIVSNRICALINNGYKSHISKAFCLILITWT